MVKQSIFISYRHDEPWTGLARKIATKLSAALPDDEVFLDNLIRAGDLWKKEVDAALARCTHFMALLCDDYWVHSNECLRELYAAVARYEQSVAARNAAPPASTPPPPVPLLLFVLGADMLPARLTLDAARKRGSLAMPAGAPASALLTALGDVNFLGPFDRHGHLVTLRRGTSLDRQLGQLRDRLLASGGFGTA